MQNDVRTITTWKGMMSTNPHRGLRRLRAQLFHVLHKPDPANPIARYVNYVLALLIVSNAACVALESVQSISSEFSTAFRYFEYFSTTVFVVEYCTRLWVCVEQSRYVQPIVGRLRYALHPLPLLDLLVIATFWAPIDLRFLRVARMVRLLKVLRLESFEYALQRIGESLDRRKELLLVAIVLMLLSIYASAAVVYQLEHRTQPEVFTSIPATFWWAMTTLTTIGYGDMVPLTPLGKLFAGLISIFGIGVFALPTAIVTAAILEAGSAPQEPSRCKHCGKDTHSSLTEAP